MAPYIGVQNVFDFVLSVNPKANIIELKPFFYETLKSYGVEINILNFYMNSLCEYSLDKEQNLGGRGVYIKKDIKVIELARKKNTFARSLHVNVEDEIYLSMINNLEEKRD